jgi:hypothetical protein
MGRIETPDLKRLRASLWYGYRWLETSALRKSMHSNVEPDGTGPQREKEG